MTRDEAAAAVAALVAERDSVQANLLELDTSFGKRLLAGADRLEGQTRDRWATAEAALAEVWQTFAAYSAVADRAAELSAGLGRQTAAKIAEIEQLTRGRPVLLTRAPAPLGQRELTAGATQNVSLVTAVSEMKRGYATASAVCATAETVWTELSERVQRAAASLEAAQRTAAGISDEVLASALAAAQASLGQLRSALAADPLSFWQQAGADTGRVDTSLAAVLERQAGEVTARAAELGRLRGDADRRIDALTGAVDAARAAWADAAAAQQRAAARIAGVPPLPSPDMTALAARVSGLTALRSQGRWGRLATELDAAERAAADATQAARAAEQAAQAQLSRRDELRGLLDAYKAKASGLGAAENLQLAALHQAARDMLWTAPCDLQAAADAVTGYQRAVLALTGRDRKVGQS